MNGSFGKKYGFTMVEVLISVGIVSVVVLSIIATATFAISFSRMEKARTLAQDISRNVISQYVRTVDFNYLKSRIGNESVKSEVLFLSVDGVYINNLGQASALSEDLRKLKNSKCELILRKMADPNQLDVKVRILWNLDRTGLETSKTKSLELSTISSFGDMNLQRVSRLAKPTEGNSGFASDCDPACVSGKNCIGGICVDNNCNPACAIGERCVNGSCQSNSCDSGCGDGQICSGGVCIDYCDPACQADQFCKQGVCYDRCVDSSDCTEDNVCIEGFCRSGTSCNPSDQSGCAYDEFCNSAKNQCEKAFCSPICGVNQACIHGECQSVYCCSGSSCSYPEFPCLSGYQCSSGSCEKIENPNCQYTENNIEHIGSCSDGYYCPAAPEGCKDCSLLSTNRPQGCTCETNDQCASGFSCDSKTKICI